MPHYQILTSGPCPLQYALNMDDAKTYAERRVALKRGWTVVWTDAAHGHASHGMIYNSKGRIVRGNGVTVVEYIDYEEIALDNNDLLMVSMFRQPDGMWVGFDVMGQRVTAGDRSTMLQILNTRPLSPQMHLCSETDPQPAHNSWAKGETFMCPLCQWESMAEYWGYMFGIASPKFTRPWQIGHPQPCTPKREVPPPVIESVRQKVVSHYGL